MKPIALLDDESGTPTIAARGAENPLLHIDGLRETFVLGFNYNFIGSAFGVLLDLRNSLDVDWPDTGVIVCRGVDQCSWRGVEKPDRYVLTVEGIQMRSVAGLCLFEVSTWPDPGNTLQVRCKSVELHLGWCNVSDPPSLLADPGPVGIDYRIERWLMDIDIVESYAVAAGARGA